MIYPICKLLDEKEVELKTDKLSDKQKKDFIRSIEIIKFIEVGRDITYVPLNDYMVETIETICKEKENYEVLQKIKQKVEKRKLIKIDSIVEFAGSSYTVVSLDSENMEIDIKQNFSIGLIYKKIGIIEVRFLK